MAPARVFSKWIVAALLSLFLVAPVTAQETGVAPPRTLDTMFADLLTAEPRVARRIEREIWNVWSKSGSATADLLLQRGREAMREGKLDAAIDHLTALVDHAPDFTEGWNARATAYFQAGLYGPSVADIAEVLKREPRHFGALAGFGAILEATGKEAEALEVYKAALAIHPHLAGIGSAVARLELKRSGQNL
ncbi:MAG TPA: tetratricopeptide repeat protein [Paracoccaceae bacterium]|nr:tetratricopeptide repeat protein [Paracoccaceae bacterium]HMO73069.1 tetratricopeptide repeat protein [Paracoccaceae bacterium]